MRAREQQPLILRGRQPVHARTCEVAGFTKSHVTIATPLLDELRGERYPRFCDPCVRSCASFRGPLVEASLADSRARKLIRMSAFALPVLARDVVDPGLRCCCRSIILECERQRQDLLLVTHLAVQRIIYAYFMGTPLEEAPHLELPEHAVIVLSPGPYECKCEIIEQQSPGGLV